MLVTFSSHNCVSYMCPAGYETDELRNSVRLNLVRVYPDQPNEWGGKGVIKRMDHDGKLFPSVEEATEFAHERGYLKEHVTQSDLRARRVAEGFNPKTRMYEGPNPPQWWIDRGRPVMK